VEKNISQWGCMINSTFYNLGVILCLDI